MDKVAPQRSTLVEGIGDEILYGLVALIAFAVPLSVLIINNRLRQQPWPQIHPEIARNIEQTRQRLQERNHPHTHTAPPRNIDETRQRHREEPHPHPAPAPSSRTHGSRRARRDDMTCPICMVPATFAVETNCGHLFCGQCILTYWTHGQWFGAVACPVCRQQVTILLQCFSDHENRSDLADKREILSKINDYNRRFSDEPRPWMDYIRDLPTLLRHAVVYLFTERGFVTVYRLRVAMICLFLFFYIILPFDIIPEAVFGVIGLLDDLFILILAVIGITVIFRHELADHGFI